MNVFSILSACFFNWVCLSSAYWLTEFFLKVLQVLWKLLFFQSFTNNFFQAVACLFPLFMVCFVIYKVYFSFLLIHIFFFLNFYIEKFQVWILWCRFTSYLHFATFNIFFTALSECELLLSFESFSFSFSFFIIHIWTFSNMLLKSKSKRILVRIVFSCM